MLTIVTHIQNIVGVYLASSESAQADPGDSVVYEHTITNNGNVTDTSSFSAASTAGWPYSLPPDAVVGSGQSAAVVLTVTVPSGAVGTIHVIVSVPADAVDQTVDETTVTITSQADGTKTAVQTDTTTVQKGDFYVYLPLIVK